MAPVQPLPHMPRTSLSPPEPLQQAIGTIILKKLYLLEFLLLNRICSSALQLLPLAPIGESQTIQGSDGIHQKIQQDNQRQNA